MCCIRSWLSSFEWRVASKFEERVKLIRHWSLAIGNLCLYLRAFSQAGFTSHLQLLRGGSAFYLKMVVQFNWNRH